MFATSDAPDLAWLLFVTPIACCIAFVALLWTVAYRWSLPRSLGVVLAFAAFVLVSIALLRAKDVLHPAIRWLVSSHQLKSEVLAQSAPKDGELRHLEWAGDGWGGAPIGDWMGYVVFDPSNSLPAHARYANPVNLNGIPCHVISIHRLEPEWYSVVVGMNEFWDAMHPHCGALALKVKDQN